MADPSDTVADWSSGFPPRSRTHGDVYFSAEDGLAEARAVFLDGCGLPEAWRDRRGFCVAEIGFGTGLNIAALIDLWRRDPAPHGNLHIFSVEQSPLRAEEAARALRAWPQVSEAAERLLASWPGRSPGFHRIWLDDWRITLDLAVMEAGEALLQWSGRADAWFFDGFAPSLEPQVWRPEVLELVAARSKPDARAATYTVAGAVRRGLSAAGFVVERRPGHGKKRERLEARMAGPAARSASLPTVAIVGAGVAGASAAAALRVLGVEARVFEPAGRGGGASGGPVALSAPRLDAGLGSISRLFAQAAEYAAAVYDAAGDVVLGRGAVRLAADSRDQRRFAVIADSTLFDPPAAQLTLDEAAALLGEPSATALTLPNARVVRPARLLAHWLPNVERATIGGLRRDGDRWSLLTTAGEAVGAFDAVIVAAGPACADLVGPLPVIPVRGQASVASGVDVPVACSGAGYALPSDDGVLFGATYDRGDALVDTRPADDARNLELIGRSLPRLAERLACAPVRGWAAVRAATPDNLPLAGPAATIGDGVFLLTGLGSRGFVLAPLLGAHLAAMIAGAPSPLPADLARLVDPARFAARARRKGRGG